MFSERYFFAFRPLFIFFMRAVHTAQVLSLLRTCQRIHLYLVNTVNPIIHLTLSILPCKRIAYSSMNPHQLPRPQIDQIDSEHIMVNALSGY